MFLPVHQYVDERVAHLARRFERTRMVTIAEDIPSSSHDAVGGARESNRHPDKTARERGLVVRLDQKMDVIGLHRKVHDSKPRSRRLGERATDLEKDELLTQAGDPPHGA